MEIVGWISSILLLLTLLTQIHKQWSAGTSEGVSRWLFVGQLLTSIGFTIYSVSTGNVVFIVTNSLMIVSSVVGLFIYMLFARRTKND